MTDDHTFENDAEFDAYLFDRFGRDRIPPTPPSADSLRALHARLPLPAGARLRRSPRLASDAAWRNSGRWGIVGVVVFVTAAGYAMLNGNRSTPVPAPMHEVVTPPGMRAELSLADGSTVTVAPASRLRYANDFANLERREVFVEGEAFFRVAHDPGRPFVVHTANVTTHDIGTAFTVRDYPGDRASRVVVESGKVSVAPLIKGRAPLPVLNAGDIATIDASGRSTTVHSSDLSEYFAWMQEKIVFRDAPFADVVVELGRWYGIDCTLGDAALGRRHLTATLTTTSPNEVIDIIAASMGARYVRHGTKLTFYAK